MSEETLARNIRKFDGSNFQAWKFRMNSLFIAYGLSDIISGERQKPVDMDSPIGKKWVRNDAKVMFLISSSVKDAQLDCLLTCSTGREMWTKLGSIHEQKSASNKLILLQKFHKHRMNANDSVVQHVACV